MELICKRNNRWEVRIRRIDHIAIVRLPHFYAWKAGGLTIRR